MPFNLNLGADFTKRAITALVGLPVVLAITASGFPLFDLAIVGIGLIAALELHHILTPANRVQLPVTVLTILAIVLALYEPAALGLVALLVAVNLAFGAEEAVRRRLPFGDYFRRNALYPVIGAAYIGIPLGLMHFIRYTDNGLWWTLLLFAANWTTDSMALIGGRIAGRHKLAPSISPGKTVEGALIGLCAGFLLGMGAALAGRLPLGIALIASIMIPILTEAGDLLESKVKRAFGVKDSGHFLPGHGGILDRIDGTLLAAPGFYLLLRLSQVL
jgi:phosphatidate cytidylyltransferase